LHSSTDDDIPLTNREANGNSEKARWKEAMGEEMQSFYKNETLELVQLPKGKKVIGCKWVYTKKDGSTEQDDIRFKARLVAKGYAKKVLTIMRYFLLLLNKFPLVFYWFWLLSLM
jgi:hypothetical protein